jgi:hypothetical protein
VLAGVAVVLLWRIAALVSPSSLLLIPEILRLPVCLLGVLFLVCGVWAWPTPSVVDNSGDFTITVDNPADVVLTKLHQPGKGTRLDAKIIVGTIVYTAP